MARSFDIGFAQAVDKFTWARTEGLGLPPVVDKKLKEQLETAYEELKGRLGQEDGHRLYCRLEEAFNARDALLREIAYRRGFFDGIRLVVMAVSCDGETEM